MAICIHCKKKYFNYDNDAGTYKEMFCSKECEAKNEKIIEDYLTKQKNHSSILLKESKVVESYEDDEELNEL